MALPFTGKTVLSLFDYSGQWAYPFELAGWNVVQVDIKHGHDIRKFSAKFMIDNLLQAYPTIDFVLMAPPCTVFTKSSAQYWPKYDRDGETAAYVKLVYQGLLTVDFLKPDHGWALENPIGRLPKLVPELGAPRLMFDPCDYAGWTAPTEEELAKLDDLRGRLAAGRKVTADERELVRDIGAYTKRTALWGEFKLPEKDRIEPVKVSDQGSWLQSLGGKGEKTKMLRSLTPEGFSLAFCAANAGGRLARRLQVIEREAKKLVETPPAGVDRKFAAEFMEARRGQIRQLAWAA